MDIDSVAVREEPRPGARSCTTCAKAKAKCVRRPDQRICERCNRLKKDCYMKEPVIRKRKTVKTTRAAQLENLEHKIEHLVNALASSQATSQSHRSFNEYGGQLSPPTSMSDPGTHRSVESRSTMSTSNDQGSNRSDELIHTLCGGLPNEQDPQLGTPCSGQSPGISKQLDPMVARLAECQTIASTFCQDLGMSMSEAEVLFDRYKRLMAPGLPFVVFEPEITAQRLWTEKPFLLHVIVTVAYFHDLEKQQVMVKRLMRDISERTLINGEKNIGLVQGILIFVAWYHPHVFWGGQINNLIHLAVSMTIDLGIDRSGPMNCGADWKAATTKAINGTTPFKRPGNLDEYRAIAGVFFLSAMLAASFKRFDAVQYTKYLDSCLVTLQETREYPSDLHLVQMIRVQRVMQEAHTLESPTAPLPIYSKTFRSDLARLKEQDPCARQDNMFLQLQYRAAEILIRELSLSDLQENKTTPLRSHLEDLYHCLEDIRAFMDVFFSIPVYMYLTLPFSVFNQFAHAFITLTKLASLEVEGWDFKSMEHIIDFPKIIDEAASRFESATKLTPDGLPTKNDSFGKWAQRVRWMKQLYEAKFQPENIKSVPNASEMQPQTQATTPGYAPEQFGQSASVAPGPQPGSVMPDDVLSGDFFNYLDENFWQSFGGQLDMGWPEMPMA